MKVLLNAQPLLEPAAGIKTYTLRLLQAIREVAPECDVKLCLGSRIRACPEDLARFQPSIVTGPTPVTLATGALRLLPRPIKKVGRGLLLQAQVRRLIGHIYHEPNHILEPWPQASVVTIHDLTCLTHPQYHPSERVALFRKRLEASIARANQVITVSETVRNQVLEAYPISADRVHAIPLGVSTVHVPVDRQRRILDDLQLPQTYFLCVGALEPRKNIGLVAKAARVLSSTIHESISVVHVGPSGWSNDEEHRLLQGMGSGWRNLSVVDDETLATLYRNTISLVFPSHDEGFGLPPLEALACGTPVIASDIPAHREVLGNAALFCDPKSVESLADAMQQILSDSDLRQRLSASGRVRARSFDWRRTAARTMEIYEIALGA